jgi:adenylate kinase
MVARFDGEELKRRPDDADAMAVVKRIDTYLDSTLPVLAYYRDKRVVYEVDAEQEIPTVSAAIKHIIDGVK